MARQRFIWPTMWSDKTFGTLKSDEKLLFIGLFSLADDEGRVSAEPAFLRAQVFPYETFTLAKVEAIRDGVVGNMRNVHLYEADGEDVIALLKWTDHQRPKYPKPSKIPPPFPQDDGNDGADLPPRVGLGWVGLDRDGLGGAVDAKGLTLAASTDPPPPEPEAPPADERLQPPFLSHEEARLAVAAQFAAKKGAAA